jgi:Pro-kumamolisin, activation domain
MTQKQLNLGILLAFGMLVTLVACSRNTAHEGEGSASPAGAGNVTAATHLEAVTSPATAPANLQLRVFTHACDARSVTQYFQVTNAGATSVKVSDITIKYWIDDTTGNRIITRVNGGGCLEKPRGAGGALPGPEDPDCFKGIKSVTSTVTSVSPACGPDATHQANWEVALSNQDSSLLPPGDSWTHIQAHVDLQHDEFAPGTADWYSQCLTGRDYAFDTHFAVYLAGNLVTASPGVPPSCRAAQGSQLVSGEVLPNLSSFPLVGPLPPATQVTLAIGLPLLNQAALDAAIAQVSDPTSAQYRMYLTPDSFSLAYGPLQSDYDALTAFAVANGLTVAATHTSRDLLVVTGSAANIENALFVTLNVYQRPDGTTFFAPANDPSLNLSTPLLSVSGLDSFAIPVGSSGACTAGGGLGMFGPDFRSKYGCTASNPTLNEGQGQTIALLELDTYNSTNITNYANGAGGAGSAIKTAGGTMLSSLLSTNVKQVVVPGGTTTIPFATSPGFSPGVGEAEVELAMEVALAMAPQATLVVYEQNASSGGFANAIPILNQLAENVPGTNAPPAVISNSWLWSHPDPNLVQAFKQFAIQGQTFLQAAGDFGAYAAGEAVVSVPDPINDSALMTVVGGTILGSGLTTTETTWNDPSERTSSGCRNIPFLFPFTPPQISVCASATGGGLTSLPVPPYQQGLAPGGNRMIPDVSIVADHIVSYTCGSGGSPCVNGAQQCSAGTSASAALWAGYIAISNAGNTNFGAPLGFANPQLYKQASQLHDINDASDNDYNCAASPCTGAATYSAGTGYDLATGLGSPLTPTCGLLTALPVQSCMSGSSLSFVQNGNAITAFVPRGSFGEHATGVDAVPVEIGPSANPLPAASLIATGTDATNPNNVINTCAGISAGFLKETVCTSNGTSAYVINAVNNTITATLTDNADPSAIEQFSGGNCATCNVVMDPVHNKAFLSIATAGDTGFGSTGAAFQALDLMNVGTMTSPWETPIPVGQESTSEDVVVDPVRNLILSPNEAFAQAGGTGNFQLVDTSGSRPFPVYNLPTGTASLDMVVEDCQTGIALATNEFTNTIFLADLTQATLSTTAPTWTDTASQFQTIPEFVGLTGSEAGTSAAAIASGTHVGVVAGEFGGGTFLAVRLPAASGPLIGTPTLVDYVIATIPTTPDPALACNAASANRLPWSFGADPHTLTAYQSPSNGAPYAIFEDDIHVLTSRDGQRTFLAVVDLNALLARPRGTASTFTQGGLPDTHQLAQELDVGDTCCAPDRATGVNPTSNCIVRFIGALP